MTINLRRAAVFVCGWIALVTAESEAAIDSQRFSVDCRRLRGNTERGLVETRQPQSGFTLVLSNASQRQYNHAPGPGLRYWVVAGDVAQLTSKHKPVAAFRSKSQTVQLYGAVKENSVYTIFITYRSGGKDTSARTTIKARRCGPYVEPGIIPNELRPDRPLHLGRVDRMRQPVSRTAVAAGS